MDTSGSTSTVPDEPMMAVFVSVPQHMLVPFRERLLEATETGDEAKLAEVLDSMPPGPAAIMRAIAALMAWHCKVLPVWPKEG